MKNVRLLPVLIAAALALLLFKGIALISSGSYVLGGATPALASGAEGGGEGGGEAPTIALPTETTMTDASPTLNDGAVTMPATAEPAAAHGEAAPAADTGHGEAAPAADAGHGEAAPAADAGHGDAAAPAATMGADGCPDAPGTVVAAPGELAPTHSTDAKDDLPGFDFVKTPSGCSIDPGVNAEGDALPLIKNGEGKIVPLAQTDPEGDSQQKILDRLATRRDELDAREHELDMRSALLEAAEKRINERTDELKALETKINAIVDDKRVAEQAQFVAIISMYEQMKAKDAATILNGLDMPVLLRVARAMNPRKMAPIMAKMDATKAKDLTANMAADPGEPTIDVNGEDLASLPQIVGK